MSATNATNNENVLLSTTEVSEKKTPKNLPEKHARLLRFAYFMMKKVKGEEEGAVNEEVFMGQLNLLGSVENQLQLITEYEEVEKAVKEDIKKMVKDHIKNEKKENKKKEKKESKKEVVVEGGEKKKRTYNKKNKTTTTPTEVGHPPL